MLVITVSGKYGSGKSTVINALEAYYKGRKFGVHRSADIWVEDVKKDSKDKHAVILVEGLKKREDFDNLEGIHDYLSCSEAVRRKRKKGWSKPMDLVFSDLDDYALLGKFDGTINTNVLNIEETFKQVLAVVTNPALVRERHGIHKVLENPGFEPCHEVHS